MRHRLSFTLIAVCGLLLLCSFLKINADASKQSQIAFTTNRDGNYGIYVMDANGENPRNLAKSSGDDKDPSWSPNGRMIVFVSSRDGNDEIYVMDADGKNQRRLTQNPAYDLYPSWSYNGQKITFVSDRDGESKIYIMDTNGKNQEVFIDIPSLYPAWSPDGKKLAFSSDLKNAGNSDICIMDIKSKVIISITNTLMGDIMPSWSPDGKQITFTSSRDGHVEVYTMGSDGSNPKRLTTAVDHDYYSDWSPDGESIIFTSTRDGNNEIYISDPNGKNLKRLTNNEAVDSMPDMFDPDFAYSVSSLGKLNSLWGKIKTKLSNSW